MRKLFTILSLVVAITMVGAFKIAEQANEYKQEKQSLGKVEQIEDVYVFILSTPNESYERLGIVEKHIALTGSNKEMINALIKKAKRDYSQVDAVIFTNFVFDRCEVIKFK